MSAAGDATGTLRSAAGGATGPPKVAGDAVAVSRRPMAVLFGAYALASGAALLFPQRPSNWLLLLPLHLMAAALAFWAASGVPGRVGNHHAMVRDWYPLLLIPALYAELPLLNQAVHGGRYFDALVQGWEQTLFGMQPSQAFAAAVPALPVSEVLHAGYLSYYPIIYVPPLVLYLRGRLDAFRKVVFAVMLTYFVHYLVFIYFPVQGPWYVFPPPNHELARGPLYQLTHFVLTAGASQGAAFPSSHVAIATIQTALAWRHLRGAFPIIAPAALALGLGAVYGGYHYAIDVVAGCLAGLALFAVARPLRDRLMRGHRR